MRKPWRSLLGILPALFLASCSPVDKHVLKIGTNNWLGYQPFYEAQQNGFWDQDTIAVVELGSSTEVIRALSSGALDAAALTLDETVSALSRNSDLQIVMVLDISHGGDVLIAKPEITSLQKLQGKTIGVENTALGAIMLDAVLRTAGLALADVTIYSVTFDQHEAVLKKQKVDAVITFEPVRSKLLAEGFLDLFNSRQIPDTIIDVLVVAKSAINKYPQRLQDVMKGYFTARNLVMQQNNRTITNISKRVGLGREAVLMGYEQIKMPDLNENQALLSQCDVGIKPTTEKLQKIMLQRKMLKESVNLAALCYPQLIHGISM